MVCSIIFFNFFYPLYGNLNTFCGPYGTIFARFCRSGRFYSRIAIFWTTFPYLIRISQNCTCASLQLKRRCRKACCARSCVGLDGYWCMYNFGLSFERSLRFNPVIRKILGGRGGGAAPFYDCPPKIIGHDNWEFIPGGP